MKWKKKEKKTYYRPKTSLKHFPCPRHPSCSPPSTKRTYIMVHVTQHTQAYSEKNVSSKQAADQINGRPFTTLTWVIWVLSAVVVTSTCLHIFVRIATQCIFFFPKFFISLPWLQTTCCVVRAQVFLSLFYLFFLLTNIYLHIGLSTTTRLARVANVATTTTMPQRNGREGSWWCNGPKRCIVFFFFFS
jgi:hypothetical protein